MCKVRFAIAFVVLMIWATLCFTTYRWCSTMVGYQICTIKISAGSYLDAKKCCMVRFANIVMTALYMSTLYYVFCMFCIVPEARILMINSDKFWVTLHYAKVCIWHVSFVTVSYVGTALSDNRSCNMAICWNRKKFVTSIEAHMIIFSILDPL